MLHTPGNVHFLFIFIHIDTTELKCTYKNVKQIQTNWMEKKGREKKVICWNGFYIICATPENYHFFVGVVVITAAIAILPPKYLVPMIKCSHVNNNRFIALTSRSLCIFDFISFSPRLSFGVDKPITSTFFTLCLTCQFKLLQLLLLLLFVWCAFVGNFFCSHTRNRGRLYCNLTHKRNGDGCCLHSSV